MNLTAAIILIIIALSFICPLPLLAADNFFDGLKKTASGVGYEVGQPPVDQLTGRVSQLISGFLAMLGVIFLSLMIYGGYIWMMAKGKEQEVERGRNIIINASLGLLVVLLAYALVKFVGSNLFK